MKDEDYQHVLNMLDEDIKHDIVSYIVNRELKRKSKKLITAEELYNVKKVVLEVMEQLVNRGVNNDSRSLGAYYVLGALTLVNTEAATTLPWLFQSFEHY